MPLIRHPVENKLLRAFISNHPNALANNLRCCCGCTDFDKCDFTGSVISLAFSNFQDGTRDSRTDCETEECLDSNLNGAYGLDYHPEDPVFGRRWWVDVGEVASEENDWNPASKGILIDRIECLDGVHSVFAWKIFADVACITDPVTSAPKSVIEGGYLYQRCSVIDWEPEDIEFCDPLNDVNQFNSVVLLAFDPFITYGEVLGCSTTESSYTTPHDFCNFEFPNEVTVTGSLS